MRLPHSGWRRKPRSMDSQGICRARPCAASSSSGFIDTTRDGNFCAAGAGSSNHCRGHVRTLKSDSGARRSSANGRCHIQPFPLVPRCDHRYGLLVCAARCRVDGPRCPCRGGRPAHRTARPWVWRHAAARWPRTQAQLGRPGRDGVARSGPPATYRGGPVTLPGCPATGDHKEQSPARDLAEIAAWRRRGLFYPRTVPVH